MKISDLYKKHTEETIYVVGTGPSLRLFPLDFLKDKITIGLNRVWEVFSPSYLLSIHPEAINKKSKSKVITKVKGDIEGVEPFYFFSNNKDVKDFEYLSTQNDTLYVGRGIHTAACVLAAKMGARTCVLVGVDMGAVLGQHHVTGQNTRFHGMPESGVYREYYINAREVRKRLKMQYNMDILTLSPFLGLHNNDEDFESLRLEKKLPLLSPPKDDSQYKRDTFDFQ